MNNCTSLQASVLCHVSEVTDCLSQATTSCRVDKVAGTVQVARPKQAPARAYGCVMLSSAMTAAAAPAMRVSWFSLSK